MAKNETSHFQNGKSHASKALLCMLFHAHLTTCSKLKPFNHFFIINFQAYTADVVKMIGFGLPQCVGQNICSYIWDENAASIFKVLH